MANVKELLAKEPDAASNLGIPENFALKVCNKAVKITKYNISISWILFQIYRLA